MPILLVWAMLASNTLFEISVEDLNYLPAQIELQTSQIEFAQQLSAVMAERSNTQLVICPVVGENELLLHGQQQGEANTREQLISTEQRAQLIALGQQRLAKIC